MEASPSAPLGSDDSESPGSLQRFARQISRHTSIYVVGTSSVLVFGFVQLAVYVHYLEPSEYGVLALYMVAASFLTILYNLASLQGTLMLMFGMAEGGEDAGGDFALGDGMRPGDVDTRKVLTTGLLVTLLIASLGTLVVWASASSFGSSIIGESYTRRGVLLMAVSAGLGSIWRLVTNVPRLERRPGVFGVLNNLRPALVIAGTIPLVATGHGVNGALLGLVIGTAAAIIGAIIASRSAYGLRAGLDEARRIFKMGAPFIGVVLGLWVVHNADVFILSRYVSDAEVGTYRLATRLAAFGSYFVSGFLMSWAPLERTALFRATYARHGRPEVRSILITYYVLVGLGLVLALSLGADALVRIAPPAYGDAAELIPLLGLGFVVYGMFNVLARVGSRVRNRVVYPVLSLVSAAVFIVVAAVLSAWLGSYGAALALTLGMAPAIVVYIAMIQRSEEPVPFQVRAIATALLAAGATYGIARLVGPHLGGAQVGIDVAAFVAYFAILTATRAVPREHLVPLTRVFAAAFPQRRRNRRVERIGSLDLATTSALRLVVKDRVQIGAAAARLGTTPDETYAALERGLAHVAGVGEQAVSREVVEYLLMRGAAADRDAVADRLYEDGFDPLVLDALESAFDDLRGTPARDWPSLQGTDPVTA